VSEQDERPVIPETTDDESDTGWGERPAEDDSEDVRRFLDERPPHHGDSG
jgi:hypothetical protein